MDESFRRYVAYLKKYVHIYVSMTKYQENIFHLLSLPMTQMWDYLSSPIRPYK